MSGYSARVWLAIAEGGRWTRDEVRQVVPNVDSKHLAAALGTMTDAGMLDVDALGRYGVTPDCTIPRGLTLAEVLKATGAA